jgi:hypothetical protein
VPVPPVATTLALPVELLKHVAAVTLLVNDKAVGSLTVTCAVAVQLFASVTVTVYMPALRFVAVEVF